MEVFPISSVFIDIDLGFLHVRGGVSVNRGLFRLKGKFSPRAWRGFRQPSRRSDLPKVFSTCVEVFPRRSYKLQI